MTAQQVTIQKLEIEDKPGALQEVLSGVAAANANILHLAAFSLGGGKGETYFIPDKPEAIKEYAQSQGLALTEYAGFLLSGMDKIGAGAEVTKPLADAGVNVVLSTATVIGGEYYLLIVVKKEDAEAAVGALGE